MHTARRMAMLIAFTLTAAPLITATAQSNTNAKATAGSRMMAMGTRGTFTGAINHTASGSCTVIGSGKDRKLELDSDFRVDNANDVYVVLAKGMAKDPSSLELGKLKKADGPQAFEIPESADLAAYHSVLLWSRKEKAVIGTAALGTHGAMARDTGMMKNP